jgi:hypothetical protein
MKKILALLALAFSLSACTVNELPGSYVVSETYYLTVYPNDWQTVNEPNEAYLLAEQNLSAITRDVIENGTVLSYYILGDYDNLLPYLRSYDIGSFEVIRYDLQERRITFIIESNDPTLPWVPNYTMEFKVVVLRNQYN